MKIKEQDPVKEAVGKRYTTKSFTRLRIVKNIFVNCASILLLYTAYDGISMLQSTMNGNQGMGVWSQSIAYFFYCFSAIFFPKYIIKKFGTKTTYALSILTFIPYICINFYLHWILVIPASVLIGLAAALVWGAQSSYMNDISIMYVDIIMNTHGDNVSEKHCNTSSVTNCSTEINDNRRVSCDINEFYSKNNEKNATLKSSDNGSLKFNRIPNLGDRPDNDGTYNVISHQEKNNTNINNQIYSVSFNNTEYSNAVEINPYIENNSITQEDITNSDTKQKREKLIESTTAKFFGYHGVAFLTCLVWGNFLTYLILKTDVDVEALSNSSCLCGADFCNVVTDCFEENIEQPSKYIRYILSGTFLCFIVISLLIVVFFLDPLEGEKEEVSFSMELLMATYELSKKKEVLLLIPASFYNGMVQGFYTGDFTKSFIGCAWGTYHVGLVAVSYGIMSGISSVLSGWLVKWMGRIPIFIFASLVSIAACATMLAWRPNAEESAMFFFIAGMLGVYVGAIWSQLRAFYAILFNNDEEAAFAAFHVWYALGFTVSFAFTDYFCTYAKIYSLIALCLLGLIGYLSVEILHSKNKNNK